MHGCGRAGQLTHILTLTNARLATVATACESRFFHREPNDFSHPMWHHGGVAHQSHRGPASKDEKLFGARQLPALQAATQDLCWLLDHGYASHSATELVGNGGHGSRFAAGEELNDSDSKP